MSLLVVFSHHSTVHNKAMDNLYLIFIHFPATKKYITSNSSGFSFYIQFIFLKTKKKYILNVLTICV